MTSKCHVLMLFVLLHKIPWHETSFDVYLGRHRRVVAEGKELRCELLDKCMWEARSKMSKIEEQRLI